MSVPRSSVLSCNRGFLARVGTNLNSPKQSQSQNVNVVVNPYEKVAVQYPNPDDVDVKERSVETANETLNNLEQLIHDKDLLIQALILCLDIVENNPLIVNKYIDDHNYSCNYNNAPRPFHSIAIMLNGTATLFYNKTAIPLVPGDVFYIPQGSTYASAWRLDSRNSHISYFSMHFSFEKQLKDLYLNSHPLQKFAVENVVDLIEKYERLQQSLLLAPESNFFSVN